MARAVLFFWKKYAPGSGEVVRSTNKKRAPSMGEYLNSGLITAGRNLQKTNTDEMVRQAVANYQPDSDYRYKAGTGEVGSAKGLPAWADGEFSSANSWAAVGKIAKNTVRFASDDTLPEVQAWGQKQMDAADELNRRLNKEKEGEIYQALVENVIGSIPYVGGVVTISDAELMMQELLAQGYTEEEARAVVFAYAGMMNEMSKEAKTAKKIMGIDEDLALLAAWNLGEEGVKYLVTESGKRKDFKNYPE